MANKRLLLIIDHLIQRGSEDKAIKLWHEVGSPKQIEMKEVIARNAIKQSVNRHDYKVIERQLSHDVFGYVRDEQEAMLRLKFARFIRGLVNGEEAPTLVEFARTEIIPLIEISRRVKYYEELLDFYSAALIVPNLPFSRGTPDLRDDSALKSWVLEAFSVIFYEKIPKGPTKLERIIMNLSKFKEENN